MEQFEDRVLLSINPTGIDRAWESALQRSIEIASDLSQYSPQELQSTHQWVVGVDKSVDSTKLAAAVGAEVADVPTNIKGAFVWQFATSVDAETAAARLENAEGVTFFYPLVPHTYEERLIPADPLFPDQWHLRNTGQTGGTPGEDAHVTTVWDSYQGDGVVIAIVDDGLDTTHPDLAPNYRADLSYDYNFNDPDPSHDLPSDAHGTSVAGVAAAAGENGVGVVGAAFDAQIAGIRLLSGFSNDAIDAQALTHRFDEIDIYNNSWGPIGPGFLGYSITAGPGPLGQQALHDGVTQGRGGLGNIYVFAGGNDGAEGDNVNYDGWASSRYTIAVGAVDHNGVQSPYSEPGAPLLVSAYSNGPGAGITTTDRQGADGYDATDYTNTFGGTSSAAPLVSGVIALMLQANPNLTYRDVQHILVETARMTDPTDADWVVNGAGYHVNHKYGFGVIDADAAVAAAENWTNVLPEEAIDTGTITVGAPIPDDSQAGVSSVVSVGNAVNSIEWVEVDVDITHPRVGDLELVLVSPSGTESVLATPHTHDPSATGYHWTFTSARHWGESAAGDWTLIVRDLATGETGTLDSWSLRVYGQQIPGVGPELVAVIPNEGGLLEEGTTLRVAPRELILRFNEGQDIDPDTLGAIQFVRSGGDGTFTDGNEVNVPIGWIGIGDRPNEVIVRFAENLPDDNYQLIIKGTGNDPLMNLGSPKLPFRYDPDTGEGADLTMNFELDLGAQVVSVVPQPVVRGDIVITSVDGSQISDGDTFTLSDGSITATFEFEDANAGGGVQSGNVPIVFQATDSDLLIAQKIADAIIGQAMNLTVTVAGNQVTIAGAGATIDGSGTPFAIQSLHQQRNLIEVYFTDDELDVDAATDPKFYQLIFTQETLRPDDDLVINPVSVAYDADRNLVTLDFGQDLANLGTGAARLRIGNEYQPITTTTFAPGDAGSSFATATAVPNLGTGTAPEAVVISASIDPQGYPMDWPGAVDEPGHRDLPWNEVLIEDHYLTGESSPDATDGITVIPYHFPRIYGTDPNSGAPLLNQITEAQKQRAREIFELYGYYLGVKFVETEDAGFAIATGDLKAVGMVSEPGGVAGVGGMGLALMDNAENWGSSEFGGGWFQVAMHEIGHLLGYGHSYDLVPFTIMGSSEDAQAATGSFEPIFPGDYDIVHGQHMYRPDSVDIDMYRVDLQEDGTLSAELLAERMNDSSLLDGTITLYRQVNQTVEYAVVENGQTVTKEYVQTTYEVVARNDDFFSEDSFLEMHLSAGTYFVGVTAAGNTEYDPTIEGTGIGGVSQGQYELRLTFKPGGVDPDNPDTFSDPDPANPSHLIDSTNTLFDGDADGVPGGVYNFWFNVQPESKTIFVDKTAAAANADGSLAKPYNNIQMALAAAQPGDIVRILGNNTENDDPTDPTTLSDNIPYEIGRRLIDNRPLADGVRFEVPQGVTVMIDAGAVVKLFGSNITVGSLAEGIDHSGGALQVLGTPENFVYFTSYYDEVIGRDAEPTNNTTPMKGDWGGIVIRNDLDYDFIDAYDPATGLPQRQVLEDQGIFLNYINHADIRYGGGEVIVNGVRSVYDPIHMVEARPTITFNRITQSADAAMSADPNSFEESKYGSWDPNSPYTVNYDRVGPMIRGNIVVDNTVNGLYVRIATPAGQETKELETAGRWDDWDIVHYVPENLFINGTPGGPIVERATTNIRFSDDFHIVAQPGSGIADGEYFSLFDGRAKVTFEFDAGDGVLPGRYPVLYQPTDTIDQVAQAIADAINGANTTRGLEITATASGGVVTLTQLGAELKSEGVGNAVARPDGRLRIDPGMIVKLQGSRIEAEMGAQLIAEGRTGYEDTVPGYKVVFTSALDNRYGAGGTFDTTQNTSGQAPSPGDWGGLNFGPTAEGSIDEAIIAYAGGQTRIEGGFAGFDPIEIRQAHVRVANTRFENNAASSAGDRNGRGFISPATIYVRGAQPVIVDNQFIDNQGHVVSIDVNSLSWQEVPDWGRSTGPIADYDRFDGNQGPLVRANRLEGNAINGMEVRGGNLTTEGVWDDTDIVHVLYDEIVVPNFHHYGGLRLQSSPEQSLVVKLKGANAGITASGRPLEIDDRIGGVVQIVGMPGAPVVLTSLSDDTVGAGLNLRGEPQFDTNGNGPSVGSPGEWRSIRFDRYSHDRNVAIINEAEPATGATSDRNAYPATAQNLGQLAPMDKAGDDNLRLGFDVHGAIRFDARNDADVYSFDAPAGTEVWIDIDRTTYALDAVVELINADGEVIARSDNSPSERSDAEVDGIGLAMDRDPWLRHDNQGAGAAEDLRFDFYTINERDPGMRLVLPGKEGEVRTYYVRVRSNLKIGGIKPGNQLADGARFLVSDAFQTVVFEFDKDGSLSDPNAVAVAINDGMLAADVADAIVASINGAAASKQLELSARLSGGDVAIDGVHVGLNTLQSGLVNLANTAGEYQMQIRIREMQEVAGSTVRYADIRYATDGVEVLGFPQHHPLLGETSETTANNDSFANAQDIGNLLAVDQSTISLAGALSGATDVDWYRVSVDYEGIQSIGGINDAGSLWSAIFDIDYADGMARPDLSMWVFDSNGRLILTGENSNVGDDQPDPLDTMTIEKLDRGSVGARDPFIGTVTMPEGNGQVYYIAVTSTLAVPQALNDSNPLTRREPIDSVNRIVEEHVNSGPDSFVPASRLELYPDEFTLGDVILYTNTNTDLYTVDPFTGQRETVVTDTGDLPDSTGTGGGRPYRYGDIAMRNDGRLYAIAVGQDPDGGGNGQPPVVYRRLDTGDARNFLTSQDVNIVEYRLNNQGNGIEVHPGGGFQFIGAMEHLPDGNRYVYIVGDLRNDNSGRAMPWRHNLIYRLNADGTPDTLGEGTDNKWGTNIQPLGQLVAAPTLFTTDVTQTVPNYAANPSDIQDGDIVTVTTTVGGTPTSYTFEYDTGFDVRLGPAGAANVRDGDTFSVNGTLFEFEGGPVIVLPGASPALDGVVVRVTGRDPANNNVVFYDFEFDNNNNTRSGSIPVGFTNSDSAGKLALNLANEITSVTDFNVIARANNNRVTLENEEVNGIAFQFDPGLLTLEGDWGTTSGIAVPFEETWNLTYGLAGQFGSSIVNTVEANVPGVNVGYAHRTAGNTGQLNGNGDRFTFGTATSVDFSGAPAFTVRAGSGPGVGGGRVRIPVSAEDRAPDVAAATASAVNGVADPNFLVSATAFAGSVEFTTPTNLVNPVTLNVTYSAPFDFDGEGVGGNVTGLAYAPNENGVGYTMYAVTDTGGLYRITNLNQEGFGVARPQNSYPRIFKIDGAGPRMEFIAQVVDENGAPVRFQGLTAGPGHVEQGKYQNMLFGVDSFGRTYAFDYEGNLQPIFVDGATRTNTGTGATHGIAFSPVDYNLWHRTNERGGDDGHGIYATYDTSRTASMGYGGNSTYGTRKSGSTSWYFGLDDSGNRIDPLPFADSEYGNGPNTNPGEFYQTYDMPGGAHGSLVSGTFSLKGYTPQDQPMLYFTYRAETQNTDDYDGFRVYISADGANWELLGTNNDFNNPLIGADLETPSDPNRVINDLVDGDTPGNTQWRQARVNLGRWAGMDNLRLRFDFSTAGAFNVGDLFTTGEIISAVAGSDVVDGALAADLPDGSLTLTDTGFTIDGVRFEFDQGFGVFVPNAAGRKIPDGETLTIDDGHGTVAVFEFDKDGNVALGNIPVAITDDMATSEVVAALSAAIGANTDVVPYAVDGRIFLKGAVDVVADPVPTLTVFGDAPGTLTNPAAVPVPVNGDMTADEVSQVIAKVVNQRFTGADRIIPATPDATWHGQKFAVRGVDSRGIYRTVVFTFDASGFMPNPDGTVINIAGMSSSSQVAAAIINAINNQTAVSDATWQVTATVGPNGSVELSGPVTFFDPGNTALTRGTYEETSIKRDENYVSRYVSGTNYDTPMAEVRIAVTEDAVGRNLAGTITRASDGTPFVFNVGPFGTRYEAAQAIADAINAQYPADLQAWVDNAAGYQVVVRETVDNGENLFFTPGATNAFSQNGGITTFQPLQLVGYDDVAELNLIGHTVVDPGPLGHSNSLPVDPAGRFRDFRRGQDNSHEGVYIDDIIIGFAERGEMVTSAPENNTGFDFFTAAVPIVTTGSYQLEIRRGEDYGLRPVPFFPPDWMGLVQTFDTNDRMSTSVVLQAPAGVDIAHGDRFSIYDGVDTVNFVFIDPEIGIGGGTDAVPIYFTAADGAADIANLIADAVNYAFQEGMFDVRATSILTSDRVDLIDAVEVTGLPSIVFGPVDDIPAEATAGSIFGRGDENHERQKGQITIEQSRIVHSADTGIVVAPAAREPGSNAPYPASGRTMNAPNQLVGGVLIENNLVAFSGQTGISISGETGQPTGAVPFTRVVNNTIYGDTTPKGIGIDVSNNASPTLLNNIVAGLNVGVRVDASSLGQGVVLGGMVYQSNTQNTQGTNVGTFARLLQPTDPLFVNPAKENFYPDRGSEVIDSAVDSLEERQAYFNQILNPVGIPVSPIISPDVDLYGQLRKDDPDVNPASGGGFSVFKDRGAIDRVDFRGPTAGIIEPLDNDLAGVDRDPAPYDVFVAGQRLFEFQVQLTDAGVGIDDDTVTPDTVKVYRDGVELTLDSDYFFNYLPTDNVITLIPASGVWTIGSEYKIELDNQAIRDIANNPLQANRPDGSTYFLVNVAGIDFGDAPDAPYPSYELNDGAAHILAPNFYLGSAVSSEPDANANATATGDTFDDGVLIQAGILIGGDTDATIIASADGFLDAWVDFNADGDWNDAGEKIFDALALTAGENHVVITAPAGLTAQATFARFRFSSTGGLLPTGVADDGEVEDYQVQLVNFHEDFGDAPDTYGTTLTTDGARHKLGNGPILGAEVDPEVDGQPSTTALRDDETGVDDEDGIRFLDAFVPGGIVEVEVTASQVTADSYLQAWVDFNADGDWDDAGEQVLTDLLVTADGTFTAQIDVPADAKLGHTYARFRLSTQSGLGHGGAAIDGEVEDYDVNIVDAPLDFGDAPAPYPTLAADGGARHQVVRGFYLGQIADYEDDGLPSASANGDDADNLADEDGVIFNTPLRTGQEATVTVTASADGGYLNAWIDFNADGDWDDAGEQIFVDQALAAGANVLTFRVPRDLATADTYARFRFSHEQGLTYSTPASAATVPDGEVEDYLVTVIAGEASISGYKFNDLDGDGVWDKQPSNVVPPVTLLPVNAGDVVLPPADDAVSSAIDLGFDFEFFGRAFDRMYVSTNGVVSFTNPVSAFGDGSFPTGEAVLAPFWADADTRAGGQVRVATGTSVRGNPVVQVNWIDVGYFDRHADKQNTFSLYIEDDPGGDIVVFNYFDMNWTTGDGFGINGFGAPGAQIGYDAGNGTDFLSVARPSDATGLADLMAQGQYAFRFDPNTGDPLGVEPGLAGWTVFIDLNNNGVLDIDEPSTVTQVDDPATPGIDETGYYEFTGLFAGEYTVREILPDASWIQTRPDSSVVLPDGQTRHLRAAAGSLLTDGATFSLSDGTATAVFEFDNDGVVGSGNIAVPFTTADSAGVVAASIVDAINNSGVVAITAGAEGDVITLIGPTSIFDPQTSPITDVTSHGNDDGTYTVTLTSREDLADVNFGNFKIPHVSIVDTAVAEGDTGTTKVNVTLELTDSFGAPVTVDYATADGTATTADSDYIPATGTVTFTPQGVPVPTWGIELLTSNSVNDYDYNVWQDRVVWETYDGQDWEIYLFDGTTTRRLTNNTTNDRFAAIYGNYVAWAGSDGNDYEIYLYDIAADTTIRLTDNATDDKNPQLSDELVVWWGNDGSDQEIYLYDLASHTGPVNISNNSTADYLPVVSGRNVAWYGDDGFDTEIYVYTGGAVRQVSNNTHEDRLPQIDGDRVVWEQFDGTDFEIALYDIAADTTTVLTDNTTDDIHPVISGDNVAWQGSDGTDSEIYVANLALGAVPVNISDNVRIDELPQLAGDRLVWHSFVGGNWEVMYRNLSRNELPRNISRNGAYDWYPQITEDLVVWRSYESGNYEIVVAREFEPVATTTVSLEVVGDLKIEPDEYFLVNLTGSNLAVLDDTQATVGIYNDDGNLDLGDAPSPYPTLLADNGARHLQSSLRLGALWDTEGDGRPTANADGDDTLTSDDEDGVIFAGDLVRGGTVGLTVMSSGSGKLDAWVDFNADGDWDDAGERIFAGQAVSAGANALTFDIPVDAHLGKTYARFRLSSQGVDSPVGFATDGEVEDYALDIVQSTADVSLAGRVLTITGGPGEDQLSVTVLGSTYRVVVNGTQYDYAAADIDQIVFNADGGLDTVSFTGTTVDETFEIGPTSAVFNTLGLTATANDVERVVVFGGNGNDTASLIGSAGDDDLDSRPGRTVLTGPGYTHEVNGVERITVDGQSGDDTAMLVGTTGDDNFFGRPGYARLITPDSRIDVLNVETVSVDGQGGAMDIASMYDSPGNDVMISTPAGTTLSGPGYSTTVVDMKWTHGYSRYGGVDVAHLYDRAGNDSFVALPAFAKMYAGTDPYASDYYVRAKGFDYVHGYARYGGVDVAHLYDSSGNETAIMTPEYAKIYNSSGYYARAKGFEYAHTYSVYGGYDVARMFGSSGNDRFSNEWWYARLVGDGYNIRAKLFDAVYAYGRGGYDVATLNDSSGVDHLHATVDYVEIENALISYYTLLTDFDKVTARGRSPHNTKSVEAAVDYLITTGNWTDI